MKKYLIIALFWLAFIANAQEFQGMAVYESKTTMPDMKLQGNSNITPEMQKTIEERMRKLLEKTFILHFDKSSSIYKEEEKLEMNPQGGGGGMRMMMNSFTGGGGTHYKNVKDKTFSNDKEFFGKEFLVVDSLPRYDWKLENETKKIGDYTCYKATMIKKVDSTDFKNFRPNFNRKEVAEKAKDSTKNKKTDFFKNFDMPKEITITAWYTPEIPVNQGPENYWGLPGLILEVNDGRTTLLCSKVVLNPKEKTEIKAPKTGKKVTEKEYNQIVLKKMEEMAEMRGSMGPRAIHINR